MRAAVVAAVVAALALAGCGDDGDGASTTDAADTTRTTGTTAAAGEPGSAISIKEFAFNPDKLVAKVGDKITVTNQDSAVHTLTAKDKSVDTGNLDEGASTTITLSRAGTIDYVCQIHPFMTGTIEVT